jgi:hypothetical protein
MRKQKKKNVSPNNGNGKALKVSHLQNSIYYFLQGVSIIQQDSGYRLLVLHQGRLLDDNTYKTVKGARIGFSKRYKYKLWDKEVEPRWSPFYTPEERVLRANAERLVQNTDHFN